MHIVDCAVTLSRLFAADAAREESAEADAVTWAQISQTGEEFQRQAVFLFSVLSRRSRLDRLPHVAQLMQRLDFAGHFSQMARNLGLGSGR